MSKSIKLAQSYMDYFQNNHLKNEDDILTKTMEGTCNAMCPEMEVALREREQMVHILEIVDGKHKLVKRYARPAADTNLAVAHNLRPFPTLKETVDYLLFEVTKKTDVSQLVIYNFVSDRLRAVRQDMIIQDLCPKHRIILLEPMIRFHTYYGYLLCEESIHDYSPILNRNVLIECLKTCLCSYDEMDMTDTGDMSLLANEMLACSLKKSQRQTLDRNLIEAIYVLTNLYDESPMWRLSRLKEHIWCAPVVRQAYKIATNSLHGNYVSVCKSIDHLCPLMFCAVALFLPRVQRAGLQVLSVAYRSRARPPPLRAASAWLRLRGAAAARALRHYGLHGAGHGAFRRDAPLLPPHKIETEHLDGKMNLDYILSYTHRNR